MTVDDFIVQEPPDYRPKWKCTKCGACCNAVHVRISELDRGDGACIHLLRDNTCQIYKTRPDHCIVSDKHKRSPFVLATACDTLREHFGKPRTS